MDFVITSTADDFLHFWDVSTGAELGEPMRCFQDAVRHPSLSPSGRFPASSGNDATVKVRFAPVMLAFDPA